MSEYRSRRSSFRFQAAVRMLKEAGAGDVAVAEAIKAAKRPYVAVNVSALERRAAIYRLQSASELETVRQGDAEPACALFRARPG